MNLVWLLALSISLMRIKSLYIRIILSLYMPNVIMCWVHEDSEIISTGVNQTVISSPQPSTSLHINTTIVSPEVKDTKKTKKTHHHKKKKKHKKHHYHHRDGSEDEELTASSIANNPIETVLYNTQKSTVPTGLMYLSPTITHSSFLITETKTELYIEPSATPSRTNTDTSTHTTTTSTRTSPTNIHQSFELPVSPSVYSKTHSYIGDIVPTIKVKASSTLSLVSNSLSFKTATSVTGFPFVIVTPLTTISSSPITSSSLLSASSTQTISHPTHYAVPPLYLPEPQENWPGNNARRGGDPNEFRNQPVGLNSANRDIGLGIGIGIAGIAAIILLGLVVQRYKQKRNNQNDLGVYFSEKESHKSTLSSISTRWRPNSFIKVVSSAVSRFLSKSPSIEDGLITYPPELYSPVKATYHESLH